MVIFGLTDESVGSSVMIVWFTHLPSSNMTSLDQEDIIITFLLWYFLLLSQLNEITEIILQLWKNISNHKVNRMEDGNDFQFLI